MRAIVEVEVPDYQIGEEVSIYFKDTMMIKGIVQEPKTGHWIYNYTNGFGNTICKCSECNWNGATMGFNYCPNCGTRMESEET